MSETDAGQEQETGGTLVDEGGALLVDLKAEKSFLGMVLARPSIAYDAVSQISENDFSDVFHRRIFAAIQRGHDEGYTVGPKELQGALGGDWNVKIFGEQTAGQYIAAMMAGAPAGVDYAEIAQYLVECAERRAIEQENSASDFLDDFESRFHAVSWRDLDTPGAEHEWLIKGVLTCGERSICVGPSMSGKSFLVVDMALAVARGIPYAGRRTKRGIVLYQAGEGKLGLKKRLRAYRLHHKIDAADDIPFVLFPCQIDLYSSDADVNAFIDEAEKWARKYKRTHHLDLELVVIDTLSAATPGANENASEDMSKVLSRCARIATVLECHVMLVHHLNAAGSKPRGHSSLFANIENAIEIAPTERTAPGGQRADGAEFRRMIRQARITKQKDGEDGLSWDFVLKQVVLGTDIDGDPITSCVVEAPEAERPIEMTKAANETAARKSGALRLSAQHGVFLKCILEEIAETGMEPPAELGLPRSVRVVNWEQIKARYIKCDPIGTDETRDSYRERTKKALVRGRETLLSLDIISVNAPYVWHTGKVVSGFPQTYRKSRSPAPEPQQPDMLGPSGDTTDDLF